MGDPRRLQKKYNTPMHPWKKDTIESERALKKEYALKNKEELWKMGSFLKKFKTQAKKLIAVKNKQADVERGQLIKRLERLGLITGGAKLDEVLSLTSKDILERRLQSFVFRRGLARSMKQARQFITHHHITIAGKKITAPGYILSRAEEDSIAFAQSSPMLNDMHPERVPVERHVRTVPDGEEEVDTKAEVKDKTEDPKSKQAESESKDAKKKPTVEKEEKKKEVSSKEVKTEVNDNQSEQKTEKTEATIEKTEDKT